MTLRNVRYVPSFSNTLISIDQLFEERRMEVHFRRANGPSCCIVGWHAGEQSQTVFPFKRRDGMYVWDVAGVRASGNDLLDSSTVERSRNLKATVHRPRTTSHIHALPPDEAAAAMHRRLHIGFDRLRKLVGRCADAPPSLSTAHEHSCPACLEANATRHAHSARQWCSRRFRAW